MSTRPASLYLDRAAIGLSMLCVLHCLALPILLVLTPSLAALAVTNEYFHVVLLCLVLPTSVAALLLGCRRHRRWIVLYWGLAGIAVLSLAFLFGHDLLGEIGEKALTVAGALLVTVGHILNFRLCRSHACPH
jgi:hypothetical protein